MALTYNTPVSLVLDGGGALPDGGAEVLCRRQRRVLWLSVRDGRRVVLKGLAGPLRVHPEEAAALRKEYLLALRVDSPGVVGVYGFEEHPQLGPVIVMEYVDGTTLGRWLAGAPPLRQRRAVAIAIARALVDVHAAGVAHRDLKPDNILIRARDRVPKIIDFGHGDADEFVIYKDSLGTDLYGAPEQREPSEGGKAADVYSLGRILDDLLPERRFRRLRRACLAVEASRRPGAEQVAARLGRRHRWRPLSLMAAAVAAVAVAIGVWRGGASAPEAVEPADTVATAAPVARPAEATPPAAQPPRVQRPQQPAASVDATDEIVEKYIAEADRINARYGAIDYELDHKPENDRRRLQRGDEHFALADRLDRELSLAGAGDQARNDAKHRLWTHIVLETNRIDGADAARDRIMRDYVVPPSAASE